MMAAMTRCRADPTTGVPGDHHVAFFSQRGEDAGLVLTECVAVRQDGEGFPGNGQAYKKEHFAGWKKVAEAVHKVGGKIFAQVYHCGRATESSKIGGLPVIGVSNIKNREGNFDEPKQISKKDIKEIITAFVDAAKNFKEIGFDGIEIHGANGYLVDQFLKDCTNNRNDEYGGSVENRCRFLLELIDEIAKVIGSSRVGVKLSPGGRYNDMFDSNPQSILDYLLPQLNKRKICFVEVSRPPDGTKGEHYKIKGEEQLPNLFNGLKKKLPDVILVGNNNFTPEEADDLIKKKEIDMVSFAKNYIANPDLASRINHKWPINQPDWSKLYGGGAEGYCDYKKYTPPVEEKKAKN
jgi:2,4-dienoyl-CoA reductase-like NADH-dependent reductase (Old Yellow Enzyme family)